MSCFDPILPHHNPNEGRDIINRNFETICNLAFSGVTATTVVTAGENIIVNQTGSNPLTYQVSLSGNVKINTFSANTISGGTYFSGSTPLTTVIQSLITGVTSNLSSGFSGWTASTGVNSIIANNGSGNIGSGAFSLAGGKSNTSSGSGSTIVGGSGNTASGTFTFIGGGVSNVVSGSQSNIVSGSGNTVSGAFSTIVAGISNNVTGQRSGIGAGQFLKNPFDDTWMATHMTAVTISATTFYSGSTDLSLLFGSGTNNGIRNFIQSGISITVAENFQYLVYGDLTIYSGGTLTNYGQVVIINGALFLSGGSYINSGSTLVVDLALNNAGKYSAAFSTTANVPLSINHNLNTQDFVYMTRQGTSEISVQLTIADNNNVTITTTSSVSGGRITIIGV